MYYQVARNLVVAYGADPVSQAVEMAGANGVMFEVIAISSSAGGDEVLIQLQESNDLENWEDVSGAAIGYVSAPSYSVDSTSASISAQYVRLQYSVRLEGQVVVLAAGIHTANL